MDFERELLEIFAFLDILAHTEWDIDILDIQTLADLFSKKADKLYCNMLEKYIHILEE